MDYARYYVGPLFMLAGVIGFLLGGPWVWLGASTFGLAIVLDLMALEPDYSTRTINHPALAELPLYLHVLLVPSLVAAAALRVRACSQGADPLGLSGFAGIVITLAWLGVLPNIPVAHEFIHHRGRLQRFLGFLITAIIADPLRRLAHLRGHHSKLGLTEDSDTARRGETIYGFIVRAALTASRESISSERARLARLGRSLWSWRSDLVRSQLLVLGMLGLIGFYAGWLGVAVLGTGFLLARILLESFNYLQHYGLLRVPGTRYDRRHSWSHLSPLVRAVAFEITNHAHHHMSPQVPFYRLIPDRQAPQMPSALLCFLAALIPPLWVHYIARPRLQHWDAHFATPEERALAAEANAAAGWRS